MRSKSHLAGKISVVALAFLAGGLMLPKMVEATVSSGARAAFFPLPPARIMDTRFGPSPLPVGTKVGPGQTVDLQVSGAGGIPGTASAAVLNVTVTDATAASHLTIFPTGTTKPTASNLNFAAGDTVPNGVTVKLGTAGKVSIFNNSGQANVIVDVNGYYEDHNHDDRYDTKAQVTSKISTALAGSNYVGNAQLADDAVTGAEVDDGTLRLADMTTFTFNSSADLTGKVLPAGTCEDLFSLTNGGLVEGDLVIPRFTGGTVPSSAINLIPTIAQARTGAPSVRIVACNVAATDFTLTGVISTTSLVLR